MRKGKEHVHYTSSFCICKNNCSKKIDKHFLNREVVDFLRIHKTFSYMLLIT